MDGRAGGHRHAGRPARVAGPVTRLPDGARFATRAVHAGLDPDPTYGSVIPAIHQTSTFVQPAPGEFVEDYDYSRSANPTRAALEGALGELEGGHGDGVRERDGGRARADHRRLRRGRPRDPAARPLRRHLPARRQGARRAWGSQYDIVDQTDLDALAARAAARRRGSSGSRRRPTRCWTSSTSRRVVARSGDALVAVDNTFATPVDQRPLELGADAVVHSTTKYLGGHSDMVGGAVVVARPGAARARALRAERGRRRARAARLLPRPPRPAHAAPAHGGARRERARGRRVPARRRGRRGRALAGLRRHGLVPPPRGATDRRRDRGSSRSPSRSAASSR